MSNELDMPLDEFAPAGARALEWIARYLSQPENYPVMSQVAPGELKAALPDSAPRIGEPIDVILDDFERLILPGITHWNHPNFFAYFAISGSAAGILGELLSATLNINVSTAHTDSSLPMNGRVRSAMGQINIPSSGRSMTVANM